MQLGYQICALPVLQTKEREGTSNILSQCVGPHLFWCLLFSVSFAASSSDFSVVILSFLRQASFL